jgi:cobalt-zinc-cadmium efflux system outer membrane protein
MKKLVISIMIISVFLATVALGEEDNHAEITTDYDLHQLISIAVENNPRLHALKLELQAADARIIQSGLWPNPVFTAESENFSGDLPGFNYTENTFSFEQPLLLGRKIHLQKKLSEKDRRILEYHYEAEKIALIRDVEHGVYHVLVSQKVLEHTRETQENARKLHDFIKGKINQKDSDHNRHEMLSAKIELSQAGLEITHAERDLEIAKKNLMIVCGGQDIFKRGVKGDLDRKFNIPEYSVLHEYILKNNFNIKAADAYEARAAILLEIAKSERIPDVDLGFGVRQFEEDNSYTFVAGLSVPLPFFNRNQGGIQEAVINKDKVLVDRKILVNDLLLQLNEHYKEYHISLQEVASYKNSLLTSTQEYYDVTVNRYEKGSLPYLDVLVAEKNLIETKKKYMEALHTLQNAVANLENLCSQHFHGINGEVF